MAMQLTFSDAASMEDTKIVELSVGSVCLHIWMRPTTKGPM